jgi:hypothetical protein
MTDLMNMFKRQPVKKKIEQNKDYIAAISSLNDLCEQQQLLVEEEKRLSIVRVHCICLFVCLLYILKWVGTFRNAEIG